MTSNVERQNRYDEEREKRWELGEKGEPIVAKAMEELLKAIEGKPEYDEMKDRLWQMSHQGVWPHVFNVEMCEVLKEEGYEIKTSTCGDATFTRVDSKIFVDTCLAHLRSGERRILWDAEWFDVDGWLQWLEDWKAITGC